MSNIVPLHQDHVAPHAFDFSGLPVRVLSIDGNPWFVAKDVCDVLGLTNPTEALRGLDDDEKNTLRVSEGVRGNPYANVISESGLYTLVLRSNKPTAKTFRRWITGTVLPALRKDGSYVVGEEKVLTGEMSEDELLAKALVSAHAKLARIAHERDAAQATVAAQAPAVAAQERLSQSEGSVRLSDAGRCLGMAQAKFFRWMVDNKWIFRTKDRSNRPVPYADKRNAGLMEVVTSTQRRITGDVLVQTAYVTPKGLAKLAEIHGVPGWEL
ncbi:phage antirepressor [Paracoccus yeei]|uniref:phage antirepressor n=1 Tax=Paracoccus yeei TaxID=147645 RepID=UPI003BF875C3